jgi:hypothetical protein
MRVCARTSPRMRVCARTHMCVCARALSRTHARTHARMQVQFTRIVPSDWWTCAPPGTASAPTALPDVSRRPRFETFRPFQRLRVRVGTHTGFELCRHDTSAVAVDTLRTRRSDRAQRGPNPASRCAGTARASPCSAMRNRRARCACAGAVRL